MANKTKKEDFVYFRERVYHWVKAFSLSEYEVTVTHRDLPEDENSLAFINVNLLGRGAEISLSKDWGLDVINKKELDKAAFHEVVHLLIYEYHEGLLGRLPPPVIETMEHSIVRRLENFVFDPDI